MQNAVQLWQMSPMSFSIKFGLRMGSSATSIVIFTLRVQYKIHFYYLYLNSEKKQAKSVFQIMLLPV